MSVDTGSAMEEYRNEMLELAGPGDPSARMADTPATVRGIVEDAGDGLRTRPAPGEWSVIELLGHLVDDELMVGVRLRRILYETDVEIAGFDQDLWVSSGGYDRADAETLLRALEAMRPLNIAAWRDASEEQRRNVGLHSERGPESAETTYRMLAGHDVFHIAQMRRTVQQVRGAA